VKGVEMNTDQYNDKEFEETTLAFSWWGSTSGVSTSVLKSWAVMVSHSRLLISLSFVMIHE